MKYLLLILCLAISPLTFSGCATAPSARVTEVKTLKTVALAVDGTMKVAAQLYHDGKITTATWQQIAAIHDKFRPAYNAAVAAVQMNLDSFASPDLITLAAQLAAVLAPYLNK